MTFAIPFLSSLRAFFASRAAEAEQKKQSRAKVEETTAKLDRMIVVVAQRAGSSKGIQLMAKEVGPNQIVFKSSFPVIEGEMLRIEMLLQGFGTLRATATVEWVLKSHKSYTGMLMVWTTPEQRKAMGDFTQRQRESRRG